MNEKEKPATLSPMSDAEHNDLCTKVASDIYIRHLPSGRNGAGYDHLARESFATAMAFADVAREVRAGSAKLPKVKTFNEPAPMVAVRYADPERPGEFITKMESADLDIVMPNLPISHPQAQRCITDPRLQEATA